MDVGRRMQSAWCVAGLVLVALVHPCAGDEPPKGGVPGPDESWRKEAEDLERRAQEAASTRDHGTALVHRRAAVELLRQRNPESRDFAAALNQVALTLSDLGREAEALPLYEATLAMRRRLFAGDHPDVAQSVNNVAVALDLLSRPVEALTLYEEGLAMWRRLLPADHPDLAKGLHNLAAVLNRLGRSAEALPHSEESLAMRRRLWPGDHAEVAEGLRCVALVLGSLGRTAGALSRYQESLAILRRLQPGDHGDIASTLNGVAHALFALGRESEAIAYFEEALAMRRRLHPGNHPNVALSLNNYAAALQALGQSARALRCFEEALAIRRGILPAEHSDVAVSLNNLAGVLLTLGRQTEALPLYEEALAVRRHVFQGDHPDVAQGITNLAQTLETLGRLAEALPLKEDGLAMLRRLFTGDHPTVAQGLDSLAGVLGALGRATEAHTHYKEALAMRRRLWPADHPDVAMSLNNLAHQLGVMGRLGDAVPIRQEALAMWKSLYRGDHPYVALGLGNLAVTLESLGRAAEALPFQREAFAMALRLGSPDRWRWGTRLGDVLLSLGRPADAIEPLRAAVEVLEAIRSDARGLRSEERSHFVESMREWGDPYSLLVVAHGNEGRRAEAFEVLERGRGREMLDTLLRGQLDPVEQARARAMERGDQTALAGIDAAIARRAAAEAEVARRQRGVGQARATRKEVLALVAEESRARHELLEAMSGIQRQVREEVPGARPLSVREVQALLASEERLLAYSLSAEGSRGFVVGPESLEMFEVAGEGLEEAVDGYAEALSKPLGDPVSELVPAGRQLFERLVPKAAWEAVRGARRLYLMADGVLNRMPFEALVVGEAEGRPIYWAETGPPIAYEPSGSVLAWLLARPRAVGRGSDLVAVGDPVFAGAAAPTAWPKRGVLLTGVSRGGQAERLGLRPGDVLVAYDGTEIANGAGLRASIQAAGEGRTDIALAYEREGSRKELLARSGVLGVGIATEPPDIAAPKLLAVGPLGIELRSALERGKRLMPLPGSRREVDAIREAFRGALGERARVTTLVGNEAREAALFEATQSPRVLHLATHGIADETETASFSSLALTMPAVPVPGDDGFLTLVDLFSHWRGRLEGTDLVVLSACESTKGRMQKAEGMYALPWGFLYAGARAVVGSLWKVDDESTAFLMTEFYRRLLEGKGDDPLGALAAARLATKANHPHPAHWAAFVFTGAPR